MGDVFCFGVDVELETIIFSKEFELIIGGLFHHILLPQNIIYTLNFIS